MSGKDGKQPAKVTGKHRDTAIDPKFLELLACPLTKGPLDYDAEKNELRSNAAGLAYPIREGVPIMLPSEARALSDAKKSAGKS